MTPRLSRLELLLSLVLLSAVSASSVISDTVSTARAEGPVGGGSAPQAYSAFAARNSSIGYDTKYTDVRVVNPVATPYTGQLVLWNADGTVAHTQGSVVGALGGRSFNQLYEPLPEGFRGSASVGALGSAVPMLSIVNIAGTHSMMGYTSPTAGANTVYLPAVFRNYWGWTTNFSVQNVGTAPTTVNMSFRNPDGSERMGLSWPNLAANASLQFDQAGWSALGDSFGGSLIISADQPVVAQVNEESPTAADFAAYAGITVSDSWVYCPSVLKNAWGWTTDIRVMNASVTPATVTLHFYDATGVNTTNYATAIPGYGVKGFNQASIGPTAASWAGSVYVESSQPVAVVVNEVHSSGAFLSYEGVPYLNATQTAYAPSVLRNAWGWTSDIRIRNQGTTSTTVTVQFYNFSGMPVHSVSQAVPGRGLWSVNQAFIPALGSSWEGWAKITSTMHPVHVIVNEMHESGKGVAYTAVNQ